MAATDLANRPAKRRALPTGIDADPFLPPDDGVFPAASPFPAMCTAVTSAHGGGRLTLPPHGTGPDAATPRPTLVPPQAMPSPPVVACSNSTTSSTPSRRQPDPPRKGAR